MAGNNCDKCFCTWKKGLFDPVVGDLYMCLSTARIFKNIAPLNGSYDICLSKNPAFIELDGDPSSGLTKMDYRHSKIERGG